MLEYRHIITSIIALVALQGLIFCFIRTLGWLFNLQNKMRKMLHIAFYLSINSLLLIPFLTPYKIFRPMTFILVLLWFAFLISSAFFLLRKFTPRKADTWLRKLYPIAYLALIGVAMYNAYMPQAVHFSVKINKPLAQPLKIGVASDLHLGKLFGNSQLDKLAEIFNQEKVDLILLPGDIMDDDISAFEAENMRPHLAKLEAPFGVFATLGNHDFFGQEREIAQAIQSAGITVLWDQAVKIGDKFTIIGRNDKLHKARPSTAELLKNLDTSHPIFLLDHRPDEVLEHSTLPIDLQVSGHTHKGQIFPANFLVQQLNRLAYGYEKIGLGHYFVTSGYGFWGVPMRLGSRSEVFIINVEGIQ